MPFNGSGTYTRSDGTFTGTDLFEQREANGNNIDADLMDAAHNDLATALTNAVCKDGQSTMTGNLKMGTNKITGLGDPTAAQDAVTLTYLQGRYTLGLDWISGLACSHDTDTEHDMLIATGSIRDTTDTYTIQHGTAITKRIDSTWAAGDDAGGCSNAADSGLVQADTWYGIFLLSKASSVTTTDVIYAKTKANALADSNAVAAGYDICRLIDYVRTDASSNIIQRLSDGCDSYLWDVPVNMSATASATRTAATTRCPPFQIGRLALIISSASATHFVIFTQTNQTDTAPTSSLFDVGINTTNTGTVAAHMEMKMDGSSQFYHRVDNVSGVITYNFFTRGYKIDRTITDLV